MLAAAGRTGNSSTLASRNTRATESRIALATRSSVRSKRANNHNASPETNSPHTLWRGKLPASIRTTLKPKSAAMIAAEVPAGPPPMIARSKVLFTIGLPQNQSESLKKVRTHTIGNSSGSLCDVTYFRDSVCATNRCRRVVAGETASIGEAACISGKQMKNIAAQIAGNHRQSRNPQRLVEKRNHRFGFKMMTKQIAANHIEAAVREGQSKRVTGDSIQIQIGSIHVR